MSRVSLLFWLDVLLLAAVAVLQTPRSTGLATHEWGGIVFAAFVLLHLLMNWSWIVSTLHRVRASHSWRDRANFLLNASLFVVGVQALFSGLMISEVLLPLMGLERSTLEAWTKLHLFFSTVALVVVGLHIALNWDGILGVLRHRQIVGRPHNADQPTVRWRRPRLNLDALDRTVRRVSSVTCMAVAVSAACFGLVTLSTSPQRNPASGVQLGQLEGTAGWIAYNGFNVQSDASAEHREAQTIFVREVATALLSIGLAAVAGRTVLRLRLRSRPAQ